MAHVVMDSTESIRVNEARVAGVAVNNWQSAVPHARTLLVLMLLLVCAAQITKTYSAQTITRHEDNREREITATPGAVHFLARAPLAFGSICCAERTNACAANVSREGKHCTNIRT